MTEIYIVAFTVALVASYLLTPHVKRLAIRAGALDKPDARKVHTQPTPRMGGLAIYAGFLLAVLASVHIN
jgi:UDP-GlcNAc:undecaprenyl-phosphate GlcNAc-1-phosphate transferase